MNATAALLVVFGYVLGSLSFATILVRFATGKDIRKEGSGNAGATNVLRSHGKGLALTVAALDIGKGALAVWLVRLVTADSRYAALAGVAAVLGHVFPVFDFLSAAHRAGSQRARLGALLHQPAAHGAPRAGLHDVEPARAGPRFDRG